MSKPNLPGRTRGVRSSSPGPVPLAGRGPSGRQPILTPALLALRRLRFYRDLLLTGYSSALRPDPTPRSLRSERIALGIDHFELDAVPLWSVRRDDGAVAVPFVEFILGELQRALQQICDAIDTSRTPAADTLGRLAAELRREMETIGLREACREPPRLSELFLTGELLGRLCGSQGLLEQIVQECEAALRVAPESAGGGGSSPGE
ncbi:MAG TPA: hypothetical protein VNL37_08735 [Candidatus Polarisedimenticolia bacterium]|nr:hypothetical protein [Candidatus Polarisedimenticolia bacterium]